MLSRLHGAAWIDGDGVGDDDDPAARWTESSNAEEKDELGLPSFKNILDDDWFLGVTAGAGGSSSHDGFEAFRSVSGTKEMSFSAEMSQPFFQSKNSINSLLGSVASYPFEARFDLGCDDPGVYSVSQVPISGEAAGLARVDPNGEIGMPNFTSGGQFSGAHLLPAAANGSGGSSASGMGFDAMGFESVEDTIFVNRPKVLRPLEILAPAGEQPTLFQKRAAALRENSTMGIERGMSSGVLSLEKGKQESHNRRGGSEIGELLENRSVSGLNSDSEDASMENVKVEWDEKNGNGGGEGGGASNSNVSSAVTGGGDAKGKRKGPPAKNLMAERRRRKKLNDRLYMLRSIVPKISKMDRASILGDAIDYLKELLQRINDLQTELDSAPSSSSLPAPTATSLHPTTPTLPTLPSRVKDELSPSSFPSPNSQPARVEVRAREGRAVNIHMFCSRRPGLLLSTMRALDDLGLDIQQAVISCFNGFALDIFRAEQCKDGPGPLPDDIKAILLQSAGSQNPAEPKSPENF